MAVEPTPSRLVSVEPAVAPASAPRLDARPGLLAALAALAVYGGVALAVDFPRVATGFHSDEATYYMMGHSLARDGDLTYRREDLERVWHEFPSGPFGLFLKRGRELDLDLGGGLPFVHLRSTPDSNPARLYYGKSFAYPVLAAPFVAVLGTNGFLLFHALLVALLVLVGSLFLSARMRQSVALVLAGGFVMGSVAPSYFVWITPELFNLAAVTLAYFCWLYKEVAAGRAAPRGLGWLLSPRSDVAASVLLGLATFSKSPNALLILPLVAWLAWRRRWARAIVCGAIFGATVAGLFGANIALTGEWNYQGGDRRTFYGPFPFQTPEAGFDSVGTDRATDRVLTEVIFDPTVFWTVFLHNLGYFLVGRYSGLLPYFFPAVFATVAFLLARGRRAAWQYLVLAAAGAEILLLIVWIPYNYFGGAGVLGNRYFMNTYGLFLFLIPPIESAAAAVAPWIVGGLFTAQITLNPFFSSFHPAEHAKRGPLRLLPVELTLVNDLPINANPSRVRVPFGSEAFRFQIYFLDDNAFRPEGDGFWVKGDSTAEVLVKSARPARSLRLALAAGDRPARATVRTSAERRTIALAPHQVVQATLALDEGFPYQGTRVWTLLISATGGFVPLFTSSTSTDNRYLGVRVRPELVP